MRAQGPVMWEWMWGLLCVASIGYAPGCTPAPMSEPAAKVDDAIVFEGLSATQWQDDQIRLQVASGSARLRGRTLLDGQVVSATFTSSTGPAARVSSQRAQADLASGNVRFEGDARIERSGLEIRAQQFSFDADSRRLESSAGVEVTSQDVWLRSPGRAVWDMDSQSAHLEGPVSARVTPD